MLKTNNKSDALYFLKGVSCIAVIIAHAVYPNYAGYATKYILYFALPAFFIISGYYSYNIDCSTIKNRIIKLFKLLLCCLVFYSIVHNLITSEGLSYLDFINKYFSIKQILKAVLICDMPLWEPGWYIISMIETYLTWYCFKKLNKTDFLLKLTPLLFVLGVIFCTISKTYLPNNKGEYFYLGRALPWFLFGIKIRNKVNDNNLNISNIKLLLLTVLGFVISFMPMQLSIPINFDYAGITIYSIGVFLLVINNNGLFKNKAIETLGKKYSTMIYVYHLFIVKMIIGYIISHKIPTTDIVLFVYPIVAIVITLIGVFILEKIKSLFKRTFI